MSITGEEVWTAMQQDKEFMAQFSSQEMIDVAKPFMIEVPSVLKNLLDKKVNFLTILEAKVVFMKYMISGDYIAKVVNIMPDRLFIVFKREQIIEQSKMLFSTLIEILEEKIDLIPEMLQENGITERYYMVDVNGCNLMPDVLKLYEEDNLTIEDLLRLQPGVILNNQKQ